MVNEDQLKCPEGDSLFSHIYMKIDLRVIWDPFYLIHYHIIFALLVVMMMVVLVVVIMVTTMVALAVVIMLVVSPKKIPVVPVPD